MKAFAFSLEAAFSILLAAMALALLPAFAVQPEGVGEYLACADAAQALAQVHAFASQAGLEGAVAEESSLLGQCIEAEMDDGSMKTGACGNSRGETISFSIPAWSGGRLHEARVSCSRNAQAP